MTTNEERKEFDAVVIGAGINGSAAALHLAKAGKKTALVEQFPLPHMRGSSAGQTRIFRLAHSCNHEFLTPILKDSFKQWKHIEEKSGLKLLRPCKLFLISNDPNGKEIEQLHKSTQNAGGDPKWQTGKDFNARFRTKFSNSSVISDDNGACALMAAKCLTAIQGIFSEIGGTIIDENPVEVIEVSDGGLISITGLKGTIEAKHLIICAGPWTAQLLGPLGVRLPLRSEKVEVYYWSVKETPPEPFMFIYIDNKRPHTYGIPSIEYPGLMKILKHAGCNSDPNSRDQNVESEYKAETTEFIKLHLPWIEPIPAIEESCMYTMSPDEDMIIDYHPIYKNIAYACGFSGTGFKTAPTVGQILTDMVLHREPQFDVKVFRSDRFNNVN